MRILASIVIKEQKVVQSFNYQNYLPLGKLRTTLLNLKRWEVEEIVIKSLDKTDVSINRNCDLLKNSFINTPITYAGFIRSRDDMKKLLDSGVDRFCFDNSIIDIEKNFNFHQDLALFCGRQAMVAQVNILMNEKKELQIYDYVKKQVSGVVTYKFLSFIQQNFSEIIFNDIQSDGERTEFNVEILRQLKKNLSDNQLSYLISGGIGFGDSPKTYKKFDFIEGVILGNSLYRSENAYQNWANKDE